MLCRRGNRLPGEPSGVLLAMGYDAVRARGLIRVSLGRFNTQPEVDRFLDVLSNAVSALRATAERAGCHPRANPAEAAFA